MSWLSSALQHAGVRLDEHSLGNLIKNISPALAFTPLGVLGAGGASALGDVLRGKHDLGGIAKGALTNAGLGAGAASLAGSAGIGSGAHLGFGIGTGGGAGAGTAGTSSASGSVAAPAASAVPVPSATGALSSIGANATPELTGLPESVAESIASSASDAAPTTPGPGFWSSLGSFTKSNPTVPAAVLQGIGGIATSGSENRLRNAQADQLSGQTQLSADELAQRQRNRTALSPYWSQLATTGATRPGIPANPYLPSARTS